MVRTLFFCLSFIAFMSGTAMSVAYAQEKLAYNDGLSEVQTSMLDTYLQPLSAYKIAKIDLNYDGIYEFVAKPLGCGDIKQMCDHKILAEDRDGEKLLSLGIINAFVIAGGNASAYGVRDLWIYQDPLNDFAYIIYRWNNQKGEYEMTEKGK